jgi:adenosylcobinamide kinase/adenosylcobinamide-phosphate guanylyltransferase
MYTIIMITGGARSGKSSFAEILGRACNKSFPDYKKIAYLATGEIMDDEFAQRIKKHKEQRSPVFDTYEEGISIHEVCKNQFAEHNVFLVECLTTWLGNIFHKIDEQEQEEFLEESMTRIIELFRGPADNPVTGKKTIEEYLRQCGADGKTDLLKEITKTRKAGDKALLVVTNEIGLGLVPPDSLSRRFRDVHGRMNRKIAAAADYVFFMVSGNPVRIK